MLALLKSQWKMYYSLRDHDSLSVAISLSPCLHFGYRCARLSQRFLAHCTQCNVLIVFPHLRASSEMQFLIALKSAYIALARGE